MAKPASARGACSAAQTIFIRRAIDVYEVLQARSFGNERTAPRRTIAPISRSLGQCDWGRQILLSDNRFKNRSQMRRSSATFRWPNGPWPGEKTPYFPAKTGHMARQAIWPSDRGCLRWADPIALVRGRADWVEPVPAS